MDLDGLHPTLPVNVNRKVHTLFICPNSDVIDSEAKTIKSNERFKKQKRTYRDFSPVIGCKCCALGWYLLYRQCKNKFF